MNYQRDWPRSRPDPRLAPVRRRMAENVEDVRNAAEYALHRRDVHETLGHVGSFSRCDACAAR